MTASTHLPPRSLQRHHHLQVVLTVPQLRRPLGVSVQDSRHPEGRQEAECRRRQDDVEPPWVALVNEFVGGRGRGRDGCHPSFSIRNKISSRGSGAKRYCPLIVPWETERRSLVVSWFLYMRWVGVRRKRKERRISSLINPFPRWVGARSKKVEKKKRTNQLPHSLFSAKTSDALKPNYFGNNNSSRCSSTGSHPSMGGPI